MNTAVVSAAMIYINSTVIKEAFQRNWLSPFASPDSSPFRILVTSMKNHQLKSSSNVPLMQHIVSPINLMAFWKLYHVGFPACFELRMHNFVSTNQIMLL